MNNTHAENRILGYTNRMTAGPGEPVEFKVSCIDVEAFEAKIVRVVSADPTPGGPGLILQPVDIDLGGPFPGREQQISPGSSVVVDNARNLSCRDTISVAAMIYPTMSGRPQTIMGNWSDADKNGYGIGLDLESRLWAWFGDGSGRVTRVKLQTVLELRHWYFVGAVIDPNSRLLSLYCDDAIRGRNVLAEQQASALIDGSFQVDESDRFVLAAHQFGERLTDYFNGKIDSPLVADGKLSIDELRDLIDRNRNEPEERLRAAWDFSVDMAGIAAKDRSGNFMDGEIINLPARAVTGYRWDGSTLDWRLKPEQYSAIHFHDDDIADCGWLTDFVLKIPQDLPSGIYAAHLICDEFEDFVPFFVRPAADGQRNRIAFVASTATYLAYANSHVKLDTVGAELMYESAMQVTALDHLLQERRELGYSTYDTHGDYSGVIYSSPLRPLLTMRPGPYTFNFLSDTHITAWLEHAGFDYDVITDHDIHDQGADLLKFYDVVITATHPEYFSTEMWDAFDAYQQNGGRHMYLGGNGFYWRIAFHPDYGGAIEVRKDQTGVRSWEGEPGEGNLSLTGEPSGLWRSAGRAPQRLVGVGFCATKFDKSTYYSRAADSFCSEVAFVFDGVGRDERIGDFGTRGGGAAGQEIDRFDSDLGSPLGTLILATSINVGIGGVLTVEEFTTTTRGIDGEQNAYVRADMTIFETPGGGAVWSTGSIAWAGSLPHNSFDNNVARITENVLRRFLKPEKLALVGASSDHT